MKARRYMFTPAEPEEVIAWRKARVPELVRLMEKYKDTVYVNNAKVMEIKPRKVSV